MVEVVQTETSNPVVVREASTNPAQRIVYFLTALLTTLLVLRLILGLLGANLNNSFADLIYTVTAPIVAPFAGLLSTPSRLGVGRLEVETLFAMIVTILIGYLVSMALGIGNRRA